MQSPSNPILVPPSDQITVAWISMSHWASVWRETACHDTQLSMNCEWPSWVDKLSARRRCQHKQSAKATKPKSFTTILHNVFTHIFNLLMTTFLKGAVHVRQHVHEYVYIWKNWAWLRTILRGTRWLVSILKGCNNFGTARHPSDWLGPVSSNTYKHTCLQTQVADLLDIVDIIAVSQGRSCRARAPHPDRLDSFVRPPTCAAGDFHRQEKIYEAPVAWG